MDGAVLILLAALAAMLYASVGHGGASAYLALLSLAGFARDEMVPTALALNILVATLGAAHYARAGHFDGRLLLPFIFASIPAAYLGGTVTVSEDVFSLLLGLALLIAALRFLMPIPSVVAVREISNGRLWGVGLPSGFILGFLSGLIGIGGGIFLSPMLLLTRWADVKKTAAVSACFIALNSVAGLAGHFQRGVPERAFSLTLSLGVAVLAGGTLGAYWGAFRLAHATLQRVLGIVLLIAAAKMLKTAF